ncbi:BgTH12-05359 [Blumeria graminis f. sp. triticale]|uniref:BgTH12-05359 n=1 Tax=Blumeria graminis f. sp. triticale TaxID=1689686 RepID=A0A9W4DJ90_BLUGR|nr:BgTH12-05359 [Blumeria graminis f. sp. triticale]
MTRPIPRTPRSQCLSIEIYRRIQESIPHFRTFRFALN